MLDEGVYQPTPLCSKNLTFYTRDDQVYNEIDVVDLLGVICIWMDYNKLLQKIEEIQKFYWIIEYTKWLNCAQDIWHFTLNMIKSTMNLMWLICWELYALCMDYNKLLEKLVAMELELDPLRMDLGIPVHKMTWISPCASSNPLNQPWKR